MLDASGSYSTTYAVVRTWTTAAEPVDCTRMSCVLELVVLHDAPRVITITDVPLTFAPQPPLPLSISLHIPSVTVQNNAAAVTYVVECDRTALITIEGTLTQDDGAATGSFHATTQCFAGFRYSGKALTTGSPGSLHPGSAHVSATASATYVEVTATSTIDQLTTINPK